MFSQNYVKGPKKRSNLIDFLSKLLTLILLSFSFYCIFVINNDQRQFFLKITMILMLIFYFVTFIKHLISSDNKFRTLFFDTQLHYFANDLIFFFFKSYSQLFFLTRTVFFFFKCIKAFDYMISLRSYGLSDKLYEITRPILKSPFIPRIIAFLEIAMLPYLIIKAGILRNRTSSIVCTAYFFIIILFFYRDEPEHRYIWESIENKMFSSSQQKYLSSIFSKIELIGYSLYPISYKY